MKAIKNVTFSFVAVTLLLFQLMTPIAVHADDETPVSPTDTLPELHTPKQNETVPAESPLPAVSVPPTAQTSKSLQSHQISQSRPASTEPDAARQSILLEAGQVLSSKTNVIVLDQKGQAVALASEKAIEIIANSDPIWCPIGQPPTPGANGCTISYSTLADLIASEGGNIDADGTIWITAGSVADSNTISIDGSIFSNWSNYILTLQGGWIGVSGDASIGSNSVFFVPIEIVNWSNDVNVNNLNIEDTIVHRGLFIVTEDGDITVNNSSFTGNGTGAVLYTGYDIDLDTEGTGSGNIFINNSNFSHNFDDGLSASPVNPGNVFVNNSTFNGNGWQGAGLSGVTVMINNSDFTNNGFTGGLILAYDSFTIDNSNISQNGAGLRIRGSGSINASSISNNHIGVDSIASSLNLSNVTIAENDVGLWPGCALDVSNPIVTLNNVIFIRNIRDIEVDPHCQLTVTRLDASTIALRPEGESAPICDADGYAFSLPGGDLVQIVCPFSGSVRILPLDDTALPDALPSGFTYISALSLEILQNSKPVQVIAEGGFVKVSFVAPAVQEDNMYSVLYWDNGTWIQLNEFMLDENGNVQVVELNPDAPDDTRKILGGVRVATTSAPARVEVTTNFPGIFVLVQH